MKVLLTGNTGGIGNCIEEQLKQSNIDVVGINSKICDLSNPLNIPFFLRKYDQFDGMVHCAGVNPIRSYKDINQQEFTKVFNINTFSFIKLCQEIIFSVGSNIIAIGSLWATGTKEGRFSKKVKLGFPPMFWGQSSIIIKLIIKIEIDNPTHP